jgi:hypothetical protein
MRLVAILLLALCCSLSCSRRHVSLQEKTVVEEDGSERLTKSATLRFGDEDATLDYAAELQMQGEYARAAEAYRSVEQSASATPEQKQAALFGLGEVHANLLNPAKDPARATELFERLIAEHPSSPLRSRAEQRLRELRQLLEERR